MADKTEQLADQMIKLGERMNALAEQTEAQAERTNTALETLNEGLKGFEKLGESVGGLATALKTNADMVKDAQARAVARNRETMRNIREEMSGRGFPVPPPVDPETPEG